MKLLDAYVLLDRGEITEEEAANAFNIPVKALRFQLTRHSHRLPLILSILDKVRDDKITRTEAATALACTERHVNQLMKTFNIERPLKPYDMKRVQAEIKWEMRKRYAIEFISGTMSIDDAAIKAGVSDRQIRRWVTDLLEKYYGMPWSDLVTLAEHKRKRIADEIEHKEGLEYAKNRVLDTIAAGRADLMDVALDRLLERKNKKKSEE